MRRARLLWRLFPSYLIIVVLALVIFTSYAVSSFRDFFTADTREELLARAHLLLPEIRGLLAEGDEAAIDALVKARGHASGTRVTVVLPDGRVLGDTREDPARMDRHDDRPEIIQALAGEIGHSSRYSQTLDEHYHYVAIPIREGNTTLGVLRTSLPLSTLEAMSQGLYRQVLPAFLLSILLAVLVCWIVSRSIARPLAQMKRGAERFASGDFGARLPVHSSEEIGSLAEAINRMATQLDERIHVALQQRNEQEAVLASMVEGVIAVDHDERIINLNLAAAKFMDTSPRDAIGKTIHEVVRNTALLEHLAKSLATSETVESEIIMNGDGQRYLQTRGTSLRDARGRQIGALIVLNDITRLRRLERIRKEFVANVSHELRTPVTSIKGYAETLLDGPLNDPEESRRFLQIISRQSDRLHNIIEDLLSLSRIEQESERHEVDFHRDEIKPVLASAIQACQVRANSKAIRVRLLCEEGLAAIVNKPLLEQALVNLIDNAIKYSDPESLVEVDAVRTENGEVAIHVRDNGVGIPQEHLSRIFERFYRVDKARSRELGGTGLGLSIVKHIVQAHNGHVSVESAPGEGSTFTITLPLSTAADGEFLASEAV